MKTVNGYKTLTQRIDERKADKKERLEQTNAERFWADAKADPRPWRFSNIGWRGQSAIRLAKGWPMVDKTLVLIIAQEGTVTAYRTDGPMEPEVCVFVWNYSDRSVRDPEHQNPKVNALLSLLHRIGETSFCEAVANACMYG